MGFLDPVDDDSDVLVEAEDGVCWEERLKPVPLDFSSEVSLSGVYKVSVYAMKAGYENSDVATAEFTMSGSGLKGDTNGDGKVDVEDVVETVNIILGE